MLFRNPQILPIGEIDEAFGPATPLCRELPTAAGPIDLAYVSQSGRLTLVECKLWKNPEARREVVAQILDYAKEVSRWSYEELNAAARRASGDKRGANTVFELARTESEKLDEAEFVDGVTRNLANGRFLLLVVGDGIREGVKRLAEYLQRLAGVQFTFGLVELAMFELPAASTPGGLIVEPRVLARTVEIERAIVRRADPGVAVEEPPTLPTGRATRRRLTEDGFYDEIGKMDQALPDRLREFFGRVEDLGLDVIAETASMVLRWRREDGKNIYFGILSVNGRLNTGSIVLRAEEYGNPQVGLDYLRSLAAIIPRSMVEPTGNRHKFRVTVSGRPPEFAALLERSDDWLDAIQQTMDAFDRLAAD